MSCCCPVSISWSVREVRSKKTAAPNNSKMQTKLYCNLGSPGTKIPQVTQAAGICLGTIKLGNVWSILRTMRGKIGDERYLIKSTARQRIFTCHYNGVNFYIGISTQTDQKKTKSPIPPTGLLQMLSCFLARCISAMIILDFLGLPSKSGLYFDDLYNLSPYIECSINKHSLNASCFMLH